MAAKNKDYTKMNWKSALTALAKCLSVGASSATIAASTDTTTQIVAGLVTALVTLWSTLSASKK